MLALDVFWLRLQHWPWNKLAAAAALALTKLRLKLQCWP
jgi:hypothetical protein